MPKFNGHTVFNVVMIVFGASIMAAVVCGQILPAIGQALILHRAF